MMTKMKLQCSGERMAFWINKSIEYTQGTKKKKSDRYLTWYTKINPEQIEKQNMKEYNMIYG